MRAPAEETFHGNKIAILVVLSFAALFTALAYSELRDPASRDLTTALTFFVILAPFAAARVYLLSLRVSVHPYGISKHTWFGANEIRWDDVERFYCSATKRSVNFIPIGTYYYFKPVDREGNKVVLSNSVERPSELGQRLLKGTFEPLYRRAAQLFDSGAELEFGPISLSRDRGLRIRWLFWNKQIPLDQVSEYRMGNGRLYIFKGGDKRTTGTPISRVPNVFVLVALLNAVYHPNAETKPSASK